MRAGDANKFFVLPPLVILARADTPLMNIVRNVDVGFLYFLDIDILERHDTHRLDETAGTVHIPYPCISQLHVEVDVLACGTNIEIHFCSLDRNGARSPRRT